MVKERTGSMTPTPGTVAPTPPTKKARTRSVAKAVTKAPPTEEEDDGDPNTRLFGKMTTTPVKRKESTWVGIMPEVVEAALPYEPGDIFGEGNTLHEMVRKVLAMYHNAFRVGPTEQKKVTDPKTWKTIFDGAHGRSERNSTFKGTEKLTIQTLAVKLSRTDPEVLIQAKLVHNGELAENNMTTAWEGAKRFLGSDWTPKKPTEKAASVTNTTPKKKSSMKGQPVTPPAPLLRKEVVRPGAGDKPQRPKRQVQLELSQFLKHYERYDFKLMPIKGGVKFSTTAERIKGWLAMLQEIDPTVRILTWSDNDDARPITDPKFCPSDVLKLRPYFPGISQDPLNQMWMKVRLSMDGDPKKLQSFQQECQWWYTAQEWLSLRPLRDAEKVIDLGVLVYTGNFTDVPALMKRINGALNIPTEIGGKTVTCRDIPEGTDLPQACTDRKHMWRMKYRNPVKVVVKDGYEQTAKRALYELLGKKPFNKLPKGMKVRFVPRRDLTTLTELGQKKRADAFERHSRLIRQHVPIVIEGITMLDTPDKTTGTTLRQVLEDMKSHTSNRILFHSVDRGTARTDSPTTVVLIAPMEHMTVAGPLAKVLAAYCMQRVSPTTSDWFTETMIEAAEGVKFGPHGLTFTSEEDQYMDVMDDDMYGLPEIEADTDFQVDISPALLDETARNHRRHPRTEDSTWDTLAGRSLYGTSTVARRVANGDDDTSTGTKRSADSVSSNGKRGAEDGQMEHQPQRKSPYKPPATDSQDVTSSLTDSMDATAQAAAKIAILQQMLAGKGISFESSEATVEAMMSQATLGKPNEPAEDQPNAEMGSGQDSV